MNIATVLLLEDMGANYQVVVGLNVTAEPGRDCCLPGSPTGGQCCVTYNLAAERQFGIDSSQLYGVVDLPGRPNMIQTHSSVGRPGYQFNTAQYTRDGDTALRNSGNPMSQPLRMFQFIIGKYRFTLFSFANESDCAFTCFSDNSNSTTSTCTSAPPPTNVPTTSDTPSTNTVSTDTLSPPTGETFSNLPPPSSLSTVSQIVSVKSSTTQLFCSQTPHANTSCHPCGFCIVLLCYCWGCIVL